jgi:uncharacterized membrane protein
MPIFVIAYAVALIVMGALDGIWFSLTVSKLYRPSLGTLMAQRPFIPAAIIFYLLYIAGLTYLVVLPALSADQFQSAIGRGAIFGLVAYGTYDLTNLAIIRNWPVNVTIIDLVWGTLLTAITAAVAFQITKIIGY